MENIRDIYGDIKDQIKLITFFIIFSFVVGLGTAVLSNSSFKAYITVAPSERLTMDGGFSSLASGIQGSSLLPGLLNSESSSVQIALATLNSKSFLTDFVKKYDLYTELGNPDSSWDIHKEMTKRMEIEKSSGSVLINIYFELEDPILASEVINNLIKELNNYLRNKELEKINRNIKIYKEEITKTQKVNELNMLFFLLESQISKQVALSNEDEYSLKVIDTSQAPREQNWPNYMIITTFSLLLFIVLTCASLVLIFLRRKLKLITKGD